MAVAPTSSSSTAAAQAAAAERQRQAELARQRELERQRQLAQQRQQAEARRQAAQAAAEKAHAAEQQRAQAQAAQRRATETRDSAQTRLAQVNTQLAQHNPLALPPPGQPFGPPSTPSASGPSLTTLQHRQAALQDEVTQANHKVATTTAALNTATTAADAAHQTAIGAEQRALTAEQSANTEARRVGAKLPYAQADGVRDAYDAGSLSGAAQRKLFGGPGVVTQEEATQADAAHLHELSQTDPAAAASELQQQLTSRGTDAQRRALLTASKPALTSMVNGLATATPDDASATVQSLAQSAQLAGSADHTIADTLRDGVLTSEQGDNASPALNDALKGALADHSTDPATQALAGQLAHSYRAGNSFGHADALHAMDGFARATSETPAEAAVHGQVQVGTVADAKQKAQAAQDDLRTSAQAEVHRLMGLDPASLPKGTTLDRTDGSVTLTQRDASGQVVGQTVGSIDGENVALTEQTWNQHGQTQVTQVSADATSATKTQAQFAADATAPRTAATSSDLNALESSRRDDLTLSKSTVATTEAGLEQTDLSIRGGGLTSSKKIYSQQDGTDGIDGSLDDKFHAGPIDRVETQTFTLPPASAVGADGKPTPPSYTRQLQFSQDGVSATSTATQPLEDHSNSCGRHGVQDLADLQSQADLGFDGDSKSPKQWLLEESNGSTYRSQTFVEGQPDASVVTTRRAEGDKLVESQSGKWFDSQGDLKDVAGGSTRIYGDRGELTAMSTNSTDPDGIQHLRSYRRTELPNGDLRQTTTASDTQDGKTVSWMQNQVSRPGPKGDQLVSATQQTTSDAGVARAHLDQNGQSLTLNGQPVADPTSTAIPEASRTLLATTAQGLQHQVDNFALARGLDPSLTSEDVPQGDSGVTNTVSNATTIGSHLSSAGLGLVQRSIIGTYDGGAPAVTFEQQQKWTASVLGAAPLAAGFGVVNLVTSGMSLAESIKQGNGVAIAQASANVGQAGAGLVQTGAEVVSAVRYGAGAPSAVADIAGKFPVGLGVAAGGFDAIQGIQNGDGWQVAKGGVEVAGAIGGYLAVGAAAGAWGGPAGILVGVGVGALVFGATKLLDAFDDSEHQIADVQI